jgi:uncharacterized membrane protein
MMSGFGIGMILFWVAVIAGIVWLANSFGTQKNSGMIQVQSGVNAREILDQRYARGEINSEQYEAMKKDLQ